MIITQNEGFNLNSPIVQNMIRSWPREKLDRTKFYYGRPPTAETVGESAYDKYAEEEMEALGSAEMAVANLQNGYDDDMSPLDAIRALNAERPMAILSGPPYMPVHNFTGALAGPGPRGPSYYDFNQPTGYIPTSAPMQYGFQQGNAYQNAYQNKYGQGYAAQGYMGQPAMYCQTQPQAYGGWVSRNAGDWNSAMLTTPQVPYSVMQQGPGTLYLDCEPYMYDLAVQPDPYLSGPSKAYLEQIEKENNRFRGYSNPYMTGGQSYGSYRVQEAYRQARHNYAIYWGFESVAEMEANDNAIMKSISLMAHRALGHDEEYTKKIIEENYEKPFKAKYEKPQAPTYQQVEKNVATYRREREKTSVTLKVTLRKGNKVIATANNNNHEVAENDMYSNAIFYQFRRAYEEYVANRRAKVEYLYNNALERKFDRHSLVKFCNEDFYELYQQDLVLEQRAQKARQVKTRYHQGDFKRELKRKFGRPALRNRLEEEDYRFRKSDPPSENCIKGYYGHMPPIHRDELERPIEIPMQPGTDPRLGYCFEYNLETKHLDMLPPRSDEELMQRKNSFLYNSGYEVPLYASNSSRQYH